MLQGELEELCINTIRTLSIDAVEKANSGHPGTPLGAAPIIFTLWDKFLKHNPKNPNWYNRDRFILSAGHASMLLYSILYLTGYDISLEDIKNFRQPGSKTPGHPEYGSTPGVEATTGPLGQGFANGVGMAIAERWLANKFNKPGNEVVAHYTYGLVSDGDLQEGIAAEAASLAGTLKLGKLIYLYDSNRVQQDGKTDMAFTEDVKLRFESYGWNVIGPIEGSNVIHVSQAIEKAQSQLLKPSLIICNTVIGYGSPNKAGKNAAHGEPLGKEEVRLTKINLNWKYEEPFTVPNEVLEHMRKAIVRGNKAEIEWKNQIGNYESAFPVNFQELKNIIDNILTADWEERLDGLVSTETKPMATRDYSGEILNDLARYVPNIIGGAADLAGSTRTHLDKSADINGNDFSGRNIRFGLREHAMAGISNGLALHGGIIPFCATFLIFSDYMRPSIRLAALMKLGIVYIFTHDSIGVGEDGPTHQPVEQLIGLRSIPNMVVIRPADQLETIEAWKTALERRTGPTALILSRQKVPTITRKNTDNFSNINKGGYILYEPDSGPKVILIASGSELHLAVGAMKELGSKGIPARVVSFPSWELFDAQTEEYKLQVLPPEIELRISIEAGATIGWQKYTGSKGINIGIDEFGHSAPGEIVFREMGLTVEHIVNETLKMIRGK